MRGYLVIKDYMPSSIVAEQKNTKTIVVNDFLHSSEFHQNSFREIVIDKHSKTHKTGTIKTTKSTIAVKKKKITVAL